MTKKTSPTATRVALAEAALSRFDAKISELADREREATRLFADDPTEDNRKRVRTTRTDLDDWRAGREVAAANLDQARAEAASEETRANAEKARAAAERASRKAFRAAVQPHADTLVRLRDEAVRAIVAISEIVEAQRRAASEAAHHAALAGLTLDVPRLEMADASAVVLVAMSANDAAIRVGGWFGSIDGERELASEVLRRVGLSAVVEPGAGRPTYAEQIDAALDGADVYATTRPTTSAAAE